MMDYYKILALDYGDVRIGVAMTDLMRVIASPYETYTRRTIEQDLNFLSKLVKDNAVKVIVFGLPLNMDGSEGDRAIKTREFANKLKGVISPSVEIKFQDERLSSVEAEDMLVSANMKREKRKKVIDKVAACIILESYLSKK